tara:strand:+ start:3396 stop:4172 length:777 start_codon:yes stop_codon:yes gene_type:complete
MSPPKTGSSSLFYLLKQHPFISGCSLKEPQFFSNNFTKGLDYYNDLFPVDDCLYRMEASTTYFSDEWAVPKMQKTCDKNIKIICVLRNPVERFISQYKHFRAINIILNNKELHEEFQQSINWVDTWRRNIQNWNGCPRIYTNIFEAHESKKNLYNYLNNGNYAKSIKRIWHHFDKDNVLFIKYDDFKADYNKTISLICKFLNIEQLIVDNVSYNRTANWEKFASVEDEITDTMLNELKIYYMESNNELKSMLGDHFLW